MVKLGVRIELNPMFRDFDGEIRVSRIWLFSFHGCFDGFCLGWSP